MIFVKRDDLKAGMRLARPIYNKNGVLLYERNSKLTSQGIVSIKNFGLIGIFVLEPAEPVPPMTQDDIEFERFQTICVFSIQEELNTILRMSKAPKTPVIVSNIIKSYGRLDKKINFMQNLRSKEDYFYKHSLNVAILCAMITHTLNLSPAEQLETVTAAVVHDIGKLSAPKEILMKEEWSKEDRARIKSAEVAGFGLLEQVFAASPNIRRICMQAQGHLDNLEKYREPDSRKLLMGAKVLAVAEIFDTMTAMQVDKEPASEVAALKFLLDNPKFFDKKVVDAFCKSVNILFPGVSVELNNGEKALVLVENSANILEPLILTFGDNRLIDLSHPAYNGHLEIADVMKTMDNRYVMNMDLLKKQGVEAEEPVYVGDTAAEEYTPGMV
ncbi:MAG: HD domain-containing protein [Muribaculaceae bacterium]|nr:HD domain-containing protein [Muribaculaceae bacterium]